MSFYIESVHSGKYLDVSGADESEGTEVILYDFHGGKNQQWKYKNGMIYSKLNKLVLDVAGGVEGGKLVMWSPHGGDNQKWTFDPDFTIRSDMGMVMDVEGASTDNGANIIGYPKHGAQNQQFRIVPINKD